MKQYLNEPETVSLFYKGLKESLKDGGKGALLLLR